jgi:hypothetical protein
MPAFVNRHKQYHRIRLVEIAYTGIYQYMSSIYLYILVYTIVQPVTGFRGGHHDAAMLDASQPPESCKTTWSLVI